jgi:hypothetical protein
MRAFFNVLVNGQVVPDPIGQEIADDAALRGASSTVVRALVQRHGGDAQLLDAVLCVTDETGGVLLQISFFEALYLPVVPVDDAGRRRPAERVEAPSARIGAALGSVRRMAGAVSARVQALAHV